MPKFLRTIRFDNSDDHVFERAAGSGEWAVPGGFVFSGLEQAAITGKVKQAFSNGFLSLDSFSHATFVTIGETDAETIMSLSLRLADHFVAAYGAPDRGAALPIARGEIDFACELANGQPVNTVLAIVRSFDDEGGIHEEYRTVSMPGEAPHARVWDVEEDGDA
ncbi:DUF6505 family protein [Breoghania sp. L-A4]|uniref:DUF6505 family protein n=1 Tax=Breoghania sp. L-A4 TaxID=2304600 RepID=UPI0019679320|nr:DUF6505 family protein [Breoghania sp. L-A4]